MRKVDTFLNVELATFAFVSNILTLNYVCFEYSELKIFKEY